MNISTVRARSVNDCSLEQVPLALCIVKRFIWQDLDMHTVIHKDSTGRQLQWIMWWLLHTCCCVKNFNTENWRCHLDTNTSLVTDADDDTEAAADLLHCQKMFLGTRDGT